jgi:hypothetical protein
MSQRPVIILTFANQMDGYLPNLKKESAGLNAALSPLHDKQLLEVYREESATAATIYDALLRFRDRVAIFHYGGHADGARIYLEDGAGDVVGVSALLGQLPSLQLVFLNGCGTLPQIENLFAQGVAAIIATAVPIDDSRAVLFSQRFYQALAANCNIETAFQSAVAFMQMQYGTDFSPIICKKGEYPKFENTQLMPWGLFYNDNEKGAAALKWNSPFQAAAKVNAPVVDSTYRVNSYLIGIIDSMIDFDKELERQAYDENGEMRDEREVLSLIIENLPWPIGVQVRLLATKDDQLDTPSISRIKQLVSTYVISLQFLYYVLLSQVWESKRKLNKAGVFGRHLQINFLSANDFNFFDYGYYILDAAAELKAAGVPLFLKEMDEFIQHLQEAGNELQLAHQLLHGLRLRINSGDTESLAANIYQTCADAEYSLAVLLDEIAFLVNYDLLTIRDIYVMNYRYTETQYNHYIGKLNAKVTDLTVGRSPKAKAFSEFVNNASVVLTSNIQDLSTYLNLSPFIIDKNAFGVGLTEDKATEQQLFMYAYREQSDYKYFSTQHNIYRAQERLTDQFLTSEGDGTAEDKSKVGNRFSNRFSNRNRRANETEEATPSPYAALKTQFTVFSQDLSS